MPRRKHPIWKQPCLREAKSRRKEKREESRVEKGTRKEWETARSRTAMFVPRNKQPCRFLRERV